MDQAFQLFAQSVKVQKTKARKPKYRKKQRLLSLPLGTLMNLFQSHPQCLGWHEGSIKKPMLQTILASLKKMYSYLLLLDYLVYYSMWSIPYRVKKYNPPQLKS